MKIPCWYQVIPANQRSRRITTFPIHMKHYIMKGIHSFISLLLTFNNRLDNIFSTLSTQSRVTGIPYSGPLTFEGRKKKEAENLQKYKLVHRNSQASISLSMYMGIMK